MHKDISSLSALRHELLNVRPTHADMIKLKALCEKVETLLGTNDFEALNPARDQFIRQINEDVKVPLTFYIRTKDARQMPFFFHTARSSFLFHLSRLLLEFSKGDTPDSPTARRQMW